MPFAADPTLDVLAAVIPHITLSALWSSPPFSPAATPVDVVSTRRRRIQKKEKTKKNRHVGSRIRINQGGNQKNEKMKTKQKQKTNGRDISS
jgi:hypothetical protein